MLLLLALCWALPLPAMSLEEALSWDSSSEQAGLRVPRQARLLQRLRTKPLMTEFSVKSTIISRYAFTTVTCKVLNRASEDQEMNFQMQIPATAFITNVTMLIGDEVYEGEITGKGRKSDEKVKEKRNKTTEDNGEGTESFQVSVVVPSKDKAQLVLHYEELLQRRLGMYVHSVSVRPQQLVGRLTVEVNILEPSGLLALQVPALQNSRQKGSVRADADPGPPPSTIITQNETFARVVFKPSVVQQAKIAQNGLLGDFTVHYDVRRNENVGDIQVLDGYFVHYFAPKDLPPLPKNVVFVLDSSASMVGTKLRQTKDALFTILHDLRPQDSFSIVGFSDRIKVWKDHLVPVTPDNIRDGKIYIHHMSPTGGTNIQDALQRAISLLTNAAAHSDPEPRGVSLIVFLTDGKPTVGETLSSRILNSTREAARGRVCIFAIGIGDDVDIVLLEELARQNCGQARRVQEAEDAGAQLRGFYNEIRTPLLSDIRIDYSPGAVKQATRTQFPNFFNGSELVVAGRLVEHWPGPLHVEVTANNSKFVVLKTDVPVGFGEGDRGDPNPLQRLWGYLWTRELLAAWRHSRAESERERLRQEAQALALNFHFLSPVTALRLKPVRAPVEPGPRPLAVEGPETMVRGSSLQRDPDSKKASDPRIKISRTSVDGDPHFVVDFPRNQLTVCFNIDGEPGDILRLVSDHSHSGVTVNGELIGAPAPPTGHKKQRTYFRTLTILANQPRRSYLEVTPHRVIVDGEDRLVLPCNQSALVGRPGLRVAVAAGANITITIQDTMIFVILIHLYKNPAPFQRDHLGFYIANGTGLSEHCHGLLGQFLSQDASLTPVSLEPSQHPEDPPLPEAMLKIGGHSAPVYWKQRRIRNGEEQVDCWFARNAAQLLDGTYRNYLAAHPFDVNTAFTPDPNQSRGH